MYLADTASPGGLGFLIFAIFIVVAVGSLGDYATASEEIVERDSLPRERLPLESVAFAGRWGSAFTAGTSSTAV